MDSDVTLRGGCGAGGSPCHSPRPASPALMAALGASAGRAGRPPGAGGRRPGVTVCRLMPGGVAPPIISGAAAAMCVRAQAGGGRGSTLSERKRNKDGRPAAAHRLAGRTTGLAARYHRRRPGLATTGRTGLKRPDRAGPGPDASVCFRPRTGGVRVASESRPSRVRVASERCPSRHRVTSESPPSRLGVAALDAGGACDPRSRPAPARNLFPALPDEDGGPAHKCVQTAAGAVSES